MSDPSHLHAIDCAGRAADRAAAIVHRKLNCGATSLRVVACIAPLLGMFGTALLMMDVLRFLHDPGCNYGDCAGMGLGGAFIPVVLSFPVAILACGGFHWLGYRVETFDLEMRTATLDLLNHLACRRPDRG
jgi:biopolymer transport protein ExbB/TolQ